MGKKEAKMEIHKFEYLENERAFQMKYFSQLFKDYHLMKKNEKQRTQAVKKFDCNN